MRELEAKLPQLQQNVRLQNGGIHVGQSGQNPHSLVGRVDALEEAVEVLLIAQVGSRLHDACTSCLSSYIQMCCADLTFKSTWPVYMLVSRYAAFDGVLLLAISGATDKG